MRNFLAIYMLTLIFSTTSFAQSAAQKRTYEAFLTNDLTTWQAAIDQHQEAGDLRLAALAAYGAAGTAFSIDDKDQAKAFSKRAVELAKTHLDQFPDDADTKAILAGAYGLQMGLDPFKGMTLGAKTSRLLHAAVDSAPERLIPNYMMAMSFYNTPRMWGGDKQQAVDYFKKAVAAGAAPEHKSNWLYLSSMAWLGIALESQELDQQAVAVFEQALRVEPEFKWVKYELLPAIK